MRLHKRAAAAVIALATMAALALAPAAHASLDNYQLDIHETDAGFSMPTYTGFSSTPTITCESTDQSVATASVYNITFGMAGGKITAKPDISVTPHSVGKATIFVKANGSVVDYVSVVVSGKCKPVPYVGSPATCTGYGQNDGFVCEVDGQILSGCELIPPTGHSWGKWVSCGEAAYNRDGLKERTCKVCGEVESVKTPAPMTEEEYAEVCRQDKAALMKATGKKSTVKQGKKAVLKLKAITSASGSKVTYKLDVGDAGISVSKSGKITANAKKWKRGRTYSAAVTASCGDGFERTVYIAIKCK